MQLAVINTMQVGMASKKPNRCQDPSKFRKAISARAATLIWSHHPHRESTRQMGTGGAAFSAS